MAGRGPQTFRKRQKEQQRKEKQQAKIEKRLQRRTGVEEPDPSNPAEPSDADDSLEPKTEAPEAASVVQN
jgi:hypothetical protein